jgi:hypothetical protein
MQIEVGNYRKQQKGALQGFFSIYFEGLEIKNCAHFRNETREWFNFPQEKIDKKNGEKPTFFPLVIPRQSGIKQKIDEFVVPQLKDLKPEQMYVSRSSNEQSNPVQSESPGLWF